MKKIVVATTNLGKVAEYSSLFKNIEVLSLKDLNDSSDIEEIGTTYKENAAIKAEYISEKYGVDCIADDSGIEIRAMDNKPGIYSARFMDGCSYNIKMETIINNVKGKNKECRYVCAIAYKKVGEKTVYFEDYCDGLVNDSIAIGNNGFGYDPIFYYPDFKKCLNQVSNEEKNLISHRAKALRQFMRYLNENE